MTFTNKQRNLVSAATVLLLLALVIFGDGYRAVGTLFIPVGLWFSLKHEPDQTNVRPAIRVVGWIFLAVGIIAIAGAVLAIITGR